jgi:hypothetical protein
MAILDPDGLAAYLAHKEFVAGVKAAVRQAAGRIPDPSTVSPEFVGAEALSFAMPPMMEDAFGYLGDLRFVEFAYSPRTQQFGFSDGGDHTPADASLWLEFLRHPLVAPDLDPDRYPTLHGLFTGKQKSEILGLGHLGIRDQVDDFAPVHCLLLDRAKRQPYICTRDQVTMFFPLTEPEDGDAHTEFVDGLLISPRKRTSGALPPAAAAQLLRNFLADQFEFMEGRANWPIGGRKHTVG